MNKITTEILTFLLRKEEYWDKKTGRIRMDKTMKDLHNSREALWFDRIYYPRAKKFFQAYKNNIHPEWEWEEVVWDDHLEEQRFWQPVDMDNLDLLSDRLSEFFELIWNSEDWAFEEPTELEMLVLNINPGNIAVQKALIDAPVKAKQKRVMPFPKDAGRKKLLDAEQERLF
jgi:hypothetical protein